MTTDLPRVEKIFGIIANLEKGWDDQDASVPSAWVQKTARRVYDALMGLDSDPPNISPLSNGSIDIYWATRKSKDSDYCGDNLVSQCLINISDHGMRRIGYSATMDTWDKTAPTIDGECTTEKFFAEHVEQLRQFIPSKE